MPELSSSIIYSESALDIWNDLKERFSQPNGTKIYQLKRSLYECKQAHLSVTAYFTLLKSIWDELASYDSPPPCTCGASKAISSYYQREQVMQFLYGLDESYAPLCSQLLLYEPLPSITKMYSFVLQEEKQRELSHTTFIKPEASALAANSNNASRNFTSLERIHSSHLILLLRDDQDLIVTIATMTDTLLPHVIRFMAILLRSKGLTNISMDLSSRKMIGVGNCYDGLYYLQVPTAALAASRPSFDLWHWRLGHPSTPRLSSIASLDSSVFISKEHTREEVATVDSAGGEVRRF
ncbi:hypothetical protein RHGRI_014054 [Rhododendron griersonianum]|uniref:GAG-pre-integrase domain-containing protein n=1 Tax=Rhododendron griersonianum TaxID=479676 RepID=A0AAV6K880_9ERIC|nr:hypothetical protein RHGRI_014054 [Rhododendron griersonianum]